MKGIYGRKRWGRIIQVYEPAPTKVHLYNASVVDGHAQLIDDAEIETFVVEIMRQRHNW